MTLEAESQVSQSLDGLEEAISKAEGSFRSSIPLGSFKEEERIDLNLRLYGDYKKLMGQYAHLRGNLESQLKRAFDFHGPAFDEAVSGLDTHNVMKNEFARRMLNELAPELEEISALGFYTSSSKRAKATEMLQNVSLLKRMVSYIGAQEVKRIHELRLVETRDNLTGFLNAVGLEEKLEAEVQRALDNLRVARSKGEEGDGHYLSCIYMDLVDFKPVNDTYGHSAGNAIIKAVADVIKRSSTKYYDVFARPYGDEFIILLPQTKVGDAEKVANRIEKELSKAMKKMPGDVTASIGISTFDVDAKNSDDLIQHAEAAMYYVKNTTKSGFHRFDEANEKVYNFMMKDSREIFQKILPGIRGDIRDDKELLKSLRDTVLGNYNILLKMKDEYEKGGIDKAYDNLFELMKGVNEKVAKHCYMVKEVVSLVCEKLGYDGKTTDKYKKAALIHDIGKVLFRKEDLDMGKYDAEGEKGNRIRYGHVILSEFICEYLGIGDGDIKNGVIYHHDTKEGYPHDESVVPKDSGVVSTSGDFKEESVKNIDYTLISAVDITTAASDADRDYQSPMPYKKAIGILEGLNKKRKGEVYKQEYIDALTRIVDENMDDLKRIFSPDCKFDKI